MNTVPDVSPATHVNLIVDESFGDRLFLHADTGACWVRESEFNRGPIVALRQASLPLSNIDITSFRAASDETPEAIVIGLLGTLEDHHGLYAQDPPWATLQVFGATLSPSLKVALEEFDFTSFEVVPDGFTARKGTRAA